MYYEKDDLLKRMDELYHIFLFNLYSAKESKKNADKLMYDVLARTVSSLREVKQLAENRFGSDCFPALFNQTFGKGEILIGKLIEQISG